MRILLSASQAPFLRGGAELHAENLALALRRAGHEVERINLPFKFSPEADIERLMAFCEGLDLSAPNGQRVDRLISLQFPGYGLAHPHHVAWVLHQHRAVYELYNEKSASPALRRLREQVHAFDNRVLPQVRRLLANSQRVAQRLLQYNGVQAQPLYHPPPMSDLLYSDEEWGYVFYPSRLESLKRQDLLIEAAALLRCPVKVLIGGTGGQYERYAALVERHGLQDRVRLLGAFTEAEKRAYYAHALGVVFTPFDEDLGYITLEAMYAAKPVITCTDSGGPLEFVRHGETGWVVEPTPQALAQAIEALWADKARSRALGQAGRARIEALDLSWDRVVETLCA
ncbi:MAG: glycosyltransferase family 4 protein [Xylophilus sp.]|nr:glycosyltransferase family 4 protein [Xylophilus sp.]